MAANHYFRFGPSLVRIFPLLLMLVLILPGPRLACAGAEASITSYRVISTPVRDGAG